MKPSTSSALSLFSGTRFKFDDHLNSAGHNARVRRPRDTNETLDLLSRNGKMSTKNAVIGYHNNISGRRAEEIVRDKLEYMLALLGVNAAITKGVGSYDLVVDLPLGKKLFVEVKSTTNGRESEVKRAFQRPHPEPFIVILLNWVTRELKIFTEPTNGIKLTKYTLKRVLRKLGVL